MKRPVIFLLFLYACVGMYAQFTTSGYYRVRNVGSSRYIYVNDNTGRIDVATASADMGAIILHKDTNLLYHDPANVMFIEQIGPNAYDIKAQATGIYQIISHYVDVYPLSNGHYQVYAEGLYLYDTNTGWGETGYLGTVERDYPYRQWDVFPVDTTNNYVGILPTIQLGNKYYKPFYASFPFTMQGTGMKAYTITQVYANAAILTELTGTIPAATPVLIECTYSERWNNKIVPQMPNNQSVSGNQLRGVYFKNNQRPRSHDAITAYNPVTMRVLGTTADGHLAFIKNTNQAYLEANEAYLPIPAGLAAEDTLRIMTAAEYEVYSRISQLSLSATTATLLEGATMTLTPMILPTTAANKTLTWVSSDLTVVSVIDGVLTAVHEGSATITATTTDGTNLSATCQVTVLPVLASALSLNPGSLSLSIGNYAQLEAVFLPANTSNKSLTWTSSNTSVATVNNGLVTIHAVGTATITATTMDGSNVAAQCQVSGLPVQIDTLTLDHDSLALTLCDTAYLRATYLPENATYPTLRWTSSCDTIARVLNGRILPVNMGECTVTVATTDGSNKQAMCHVSVVYDPLCLDTTVVDTIWAEAIYFDQHLMYVTVGDTLSPVVSVMPSNAEDTTYTLHSTNTQVADIVDNRIVIIAAGEVQIVATTNDGTQLTDTLMLYCQSPLATSLTLDQTSLTMTIHSTAKLTATILPTTASGQIYWSSSNTQIVTVDGGVLTAVSDGQATITAMTADGSNLSATCEVIVEPIWVTSINLSVDQLSLYEQETYQLTATILPADATYQTLYWVSSDPEIADVTETGRVQAHVAGSTMIVARAADGSDVWASCTVDVKIFTDIELIEAVRKGQLYDLLGRPLREVPVEGLYLYEGKKILIIKK